MSKKHPLGLNLCIVAAMAGMTMAPHSSVAKGKKTDRHTQHIKELEAENAQLRSEVAELRKARDQSQTGQSPPAIKDSEGDPGSAQNPSGRARNARRLFRA